MLLVLIVDLAGITAPDVDDVSTRPTDMRHWLELLVVASVTKPLVEEVMFRGLLYDLVCDAWRSGAAILATAVAFAAAHVLGGTAEGLAVDFLVVGLFLGALRYLGHGVLAPFWFHAALNWLLLTGPTGTT
jgi:membrane protease YdiL (CAAX protease family)